MGFLPVILMGAYRCSPRGQDYKEDQETEFKYTNHNAFLDYV